MFESMQDSVKKRSNSAHKHTGKNNFRSRVTAGLTILPSVDGRSTWARIMRDTMHSMIAHAGGPDITEARRLLARRVAAIEAELIHLEDNFARTRADGGSPAAKSLDLYQRMAGAQRRCLEALGLDPTMRDVTPPSLDQYFASKRLSEEAEAADADEVEAAQAAEAAEADYNEAEA